MVAGFAIAERADAAAPTAAPTLEQLAEVPPAAVEPGSRAVLSTGSGVKFGDVRVGRGPPLQRGDKIVAHVRALLPDDKRPDDKVGSLSMHHLFINGRSQT